MKTYSSIMFVQLAHNEVNFPLETWNYGIRIRKYYYFLGYTVIAIVCLVMSCVYYYLNWYTHFWENLFEMETNDNRIWCNHFK